MKKILLSFFLASITFLGKLNAQCTITNVSIAPTNLNTTTCQVTFDLSYTADVNPGSKYVVVYLWKSSDYVTHVASDYPLLTNQTNTLLGALIVGDPGGNPILMTAWPSDMKKNTAPVAGKILSGNLTVSAISNGTRTYSFSDVTTILSNGCSAQVAIKGDVWATQNAQNVSCMQAGAITVIVNDPVMNGQLLCSSPRKFSIDFTTLANQTITFSAYKDANENGVFDNADRSAGKLNLSGPGIIGTQTDVTITNPAGVKTTYGYYTYDQQTSGSMFGVFVVARVSGNNYDNVVLVENGCSSPLPVNFKAFTATKASGATALKWTTSTEINNKGFYVQRYYNGQWENITFVATKAEGGNSTADLNYAYDDAFTVKGTVQYRILQVDQDGKSKYSMVRSVSHGSQAARISVYPNPAPSNANVSVVLADATATYDIQIVDNSGRIVKEFSAVRNTQQISNLPKGQYLARVKERESNQVSVEKFIVQ